MNRLGIAMSLALALAAPARAEQMQACGPFEAHYIVLPTTMIDPSVAVATGIERATERALVNVSVLRDGVPQPATLDGQASDLLGRIVTLDFHEVREGSDAIYYLATMRFTEAELWRFSIDVTPAGESQACALRFEQKLYLDVD